MQREEPLGSSTGQLNTRFRMKTRNAARAHGTLFWGRTGIDCSQTSLWSFSKWPFPKLGLQPILCINLYEYRLNLWRAITILRVIASIFWITLYPWKILMDTQLECRTICHFSFFFFSFTLLHAPTVPTAHFLFTCCVFFQVFLLIFLMQITCQCRYFKPYRTEGTTIQTFLEYKEYFDLYSVNPIYPN